MRYRLLGPLEVVADDGGAVALPGGRERVLLAALLLGANRVVSTSRLIDALWGEDPPPTAGNTLQVHVSKLRRKLAAAAGREVLESGPRGYVLRTGPDEVDVECFQRLVNDRSGDPTEVSSRLRAALALWRGPALADVGSELLDAERARLDELRVRTVEGWAEAALQAGGAEAVLGSLEEARARAPLRERLAELVMWALFQAGRQADALAVFEQTRRRLADELGADPGAGLRQMHARVLRQDETLHAAAPGPPAAARPGRPETNLPAAETPFIGREHELAELAELLRRPRVRMLTLTGPGGSGKTRLALQAATERVPEFPDGVFWVSLAPLREAELVLDQVAQTLGASDELAKHVADKQLLILLDNFEQLLQAAPSLAGLLAQCPKLKLLVTSRERLHLAAEREYSVHPLAEAEAAELFRERALAVRSDFSANGEVAAICRQVDCLPLAVELAAARVRVLSCHQILARLQRRLPLLTGGARDLPERQHTLRATIGWSHDLLAEQERRLFRRLAVFAGGCALEAAEEVCEADLDGLQLLVEKNLVNQRDERFSMLETIREFALERLEESGEAEEVRRRHAGHYLVLAERAEPELSGVKQRPWFDRLEAEHGNLRAALGWALAAGEPDTALRLAAAAELFWETRGYFGEGRRWLAQALEADTKTSAAVRAKALFSAARLAMTVGDYGPARPLLEEAAPLFREAANPRGLIWCLSNLAGVVELGGEHERARALHEEALSSARALGDRWLLAMALNNMSATLTEQGDYAAARPLGEQSLALRRAHPDKRGVAISLGTLGELALAEGDHDRAVAPLEESRALFQEIGHVEYAAATTCELGLATLLRGDTGRAAALFTESLTQCVELGARIIAADCLSGLATLAGLEGDLGRAARLFGVAEAIREAAGITPIPAVRPIYQRMLPRLRAEADETAFSTEWTYGKSLTLEEGVAYALDAPQETTTP